MAVDVLYRTSMDLILIYERSERLYLGLIHYRVNECHNLISKLLVLFLRQSMP